MKYILNISLIIFALNTYAEEAISYPKKISTIVSKYEKASEICDTKKINNKELTSEELKYLRSLERKYLFSYIKSRFLYTTEICLLNEGAPPLKTIIALKYESNKPQKEFLENFIELISTSYSSDMFFDYELTNENDKSYLDSIPYFKEPFDLILTTKKNIRRNSPRLK